ncbi:DUF4296 domain-containing protein [Halpernia sp.]|uniref:DUF4296 domain-containing protein n=1 Tax=Halpernia sp. TaxID=2782209 RepID=UPI003A933F05
MRVFLILIILTLNSCGQVLDKPRNLISQEEMSSLVAEFALSDQMSFASPTLNMETQTRFILKKHKIKAKDFRDSYTFYTGTNELNKIFDNAQKIILEKDPKAKDFIDKKLKETQLLPPMAR